MRPREKVLLLGAGGLTDTELLAILIGTGTPGEEALDVAQRVLASVNGDLHALGRCDPLRLRNLRGIGDAKAISIGAAMELGRRRMGGREEAQVRIARAMDIVHRFRGRLIDLEWEEFWLLALSRANTPICDLRVSSGGQSGTVVDPKLVFRKALSVRAAALVLVHNHPSGNPNPSLADKSLTASLCQAGKALDLPILDHVIIAGMRHFSFADNRLI